MTEDLDWIERPPNWKIEYLDVPCSKCGHTRRDHASAVLGYICMIRARPAPPFFCPCDGFEEAA